MVKFMDSTKPLFSLLFLCTVNLGMYIFVSVLFFSVVLDMGFEDEDLKSLCYEAMKDIIPGNSARDIILCSPVWTIISKVRIMLGTFYQWS